jgi:hypothetical protein
MCQGHPAARWATEKRLDQQRSCPRLRAAAIRQEAYAKHQGSTGGSASSARPGREPCNMARGRREAWGCAPCNIGAARTARGCRPCNMTPDVARRDRQARRREPLRARRVCEGCRRVPASAERVREVCRRELPGTERVREVCRRAPSSAGRDCEGCRRVPSSAERVREVCRRVPSSAERLREVCRRVPASAERVREARRRRRCGADHDREPCKPDPSRANRDCRRCGRARACTARAHCPGARGGAWTPSGGRGARPADLRSGGHRRSVLRWHPRPPGEEHSETPPEVAHAPPLAIWEIIQERRTSLVYRGRAIRPGERTGGRSWMQEQVRGPPAGRAAQR